MAKDKNIFQRIGDGVEAFRKSYSGTVANRRKTIKIPNPIPEKKSVTIPSGRSSSIQPQQDSYGIDALRSEIQMIKPDFAFDSIPVLRKLYKYNEDVGSVLIDLIQLTNTGHKVEFDNSVNPDLVDTMRKHLAERSKDWGSGVAGIDGIINRLVAQIWIGGALSAEMVPSRGVKSIENIIMLDPETIRFKATPKNGKYQPYQMLSYFAGFKKNFVKLNTTTYKYISLLGDTDNPYGVPPFMTAMKGIKTQGKMRANIDHIMDQMGLLGYLNVLLDKPDQNADEPDEAYESRLHKLLDGTKTNLMSGFKDGIVSGFKEDHEFEFNATTKNLQGVPDLFNQNENQIANGLKTSGTFLGLSGSGTEQMLSIVFTKMLSQLKNVQIIVSSFLRELYTLELLMAGYNFKSLHITFNPSTITDDLKIQQGREIKQRVLHNLWVDGIIGQDTYADKMGEEKYDRVVEPPPPGGYDAEDSKKQDVEKRKDESDRKSRDKKKTQPKRKDTSTKKR